MKPIEFVHKGRFDATADEVYGWHSRPGALERLTPPWEQVRLVGDPPEIENGSEVTLETRTGPFTMRWVARHQSVREGESFEDIQVEGPFASWHHRHLFFPQGKHCALEDRIRYRLPFGFLGCVAAPLVRPRIERMFQYRHRVLADDLRRHGAWKREIAMHVAITGSSGLVGSVLVPFLTTGGHQVTRLVRRVVQGDGEARWDPNSGFANPDALEGIDAVVHLAGENIADGRWNAKRKAAIRDSRVDGTRNLCEALAKLERKPKVLVCASAIGYYGDRGDEVLDESASPGDLFLSQTCEEWERAAQPARDAGIRVVHVRIGVILSPKGGALAKMLLPFKLGAGGKIGSGKQYMSWIAIDDLVGVIHHTLLMSAHQVAA